MGDAPGPLPSPGRPQPWLQGAGLRSCWPPALRKVPLVCDIHDGNSAGVTTAEASSHRSPHLQVSSSYCSLISLSICFSELHRTPGLPGVFLSLLWSLGEALNSVQTPQPWPLGRDLSPPDFELRKSTFLDQFRPEETGIFQRSF